jgi:hypothetical protein
MDCLADSIHGLGKIERELIGPDGWFENHEGS